MKVSHTTLSTSKDGKRIERYVKTKQEFVSIETNKENQFFNMTVPITQLVREE